jgi:hypothetical protein
MQVCLPAPQDPSPDTSTPSSPLPLPGHKPTYPTALCVPLPTQKLGLWSYTVLSFFDVLTPSILSKVSIFVQEMFTKPKTYHDLPPPHHCCWQGFTLLSSCLFWWSHWSNCSVALDQQSHKPSYKLLCSGSPWTGSRSCTTSRYSWTRVMAKARDHNSFNYFFFF